MQTHLPTPEPLLLSLVHAGLNAPFQNLTLRRGSNHRAQKYELKVFDCYTTAEMSRKNSVGT